MLKDYTTLARPKAKLYLQTETVQHRSISLQDSANRSFREFL